MFYEYNCQKFQQLCVHANPSDWTDLLTKFCCIQSSSFPPCTPTNGRTVLIVFLSTLIQMDMKVAIVFVFGLMN